MKRSLLGAAGAAALAFPLSLSAADGADMAEVKRLIEQLKGEYEHKIEALEQRLKAAEQKVETAADTAEDAKQARVASTAQRERSGLGALTSGTAFNPQISVILDGNYYHDDVNGEGTELLGMADGINHVHGHDGDHDHGHSHGGAEQGFNFRSAEIAFSASIDTYFDAAALLAIDSDGEVDLEEAWFQTRSLPYGLRVKAGKFLSDVGYMNNQHPHNWDFTDQNLAYLNLLGNHGLRDTGVQVTWLPDWGHYTLFGVEFFQGDQEKLGTLGEIGEELETELDAVGLSEDDLALNDEKDGPRLVTAFVKYAPDLGYDHALQVGAWGARADQHQEIHGEPLAVVPTPGETPLHTLEGDAWMWGLDGVYKYDGGGAYGEGDFKLQGEYIWQRKDLEVAYHQVAGVTGQDREFTQDGFYLQGIYGFAPRWQAGLRYDVTGWTSKKRSNDNPAANSDWDSSDRWTAAVTWAPTEYSLLRLQYSKADISIGGESNDFDYVYLQYVMSLGSHGAHKF